MTTVTQCLTRALRLVGVKGAGEAMDAEEAADALDVFNDTLRALFGVHIGGPLSLYAASGDVTAEPGYIYEGGVTARTITLPEYPQDGWRVGFADAGSFATANLTIARNGRKIGGSAANVTLSTLNDNRTYFYRADTGNWERERLLALADTIYLPDDLTDAVTAIMAIALAPEFRGVATPTVLQAAYNGQGRLRARYGSRLVSTVANYI